ncbi:MAG: hypothetical protein C5B54_04560 [Acidobacteria bacterium]|nr:MAG: hypothetical protein C5B54_04560 [Acidobacteriota bacterium]
MDAFFLLIPFLSIPLYLWLSLEARESYLEEICVHYSDGTYRRPVSPVQQILRGKGSYLVQGKHLGRSFVVEYRYGWKHAAWQRFTNEPAPNEELEIRFPVIQKFWLRMIPQKEDETPEAEIKIGIPVIDDNYIIHSNQVKAAADFLTSSVALYHLQRLYFDRLEIYRGFLRVTFVKPAARSFTQYDLERSVDALASFADYYEAQMRLTVSVLTAHDGTVCPYCRCGLNAAAEAVVTCKHCGTILHESCWTENGQCTTWGCSA